MTPRPSNPKPGHVEVMVEVILRTEQEICVHDGGPAVWLKLTDVEILGSEAPGLTTIWMPAALASEKGLTVDHEDAA